jgi:hypothetical protein
MIERTYHKVLSTVVHELLHSLLAVLTPYMHLYKQLHWARIISSASHVHWKGRSRRCVWSPNHEFVGSGYRHRTVSVVRTAQTSRAQYIASIYLPRWMAVWIPVKPSPLPSLLNHYLSHIFLLFFLCHTKNHATYFHGNKLEFRT